MGVRDELVEHGESAESLGLAPIDIQRTIEGLLADAPSS
jgi:hypothetical protein